ncbi:MAG: peptide ABC transporter substrate-binding protein, partial [Puniceicoccales bacterium]
CQPRETPVERANRERILLRANGTEPSALDPHLVTGVSEHNIISALLEGLTRPNAETLEPEPGVAESWEISDDGRVYTFHLRDNARWSNGDPVTADDFVFAYRRILSPKLGAYYAALLYPIQNAEAYHLGDLDDFAQVGVKALDTHTLEITLAEPTPYLLSLMTHYTWFPVHPPTILKHGDIDQRASRWTRPGNYVGNGPFVLKEWNVHELVDVERNPEYWDRDNLWLNGVRFLPIDNLNTEERAFRAGQIHMSYALPLQKVDHYREHQPETLFIAPYLGVYYYAINVRNPPLNDVRVRRALALAINRESIAENVLRAGQQPAYHFTPPKTAGYTAEAGLPVGYEENLAEARNLLAEAGFPNGEGFPEIELLYNTSESHKTIAEAVQRMWKTELGINARLINQDWKVYLQSRQEGNFEVVRAGWIADYVDPSSFLDLMASWSGNNVSGWASEEYDRLIREAATAQNREERYAIFKQAESILMDEVPVIPVYFYVSAYLINPAVKGWHPNILDKHPYQAIRLESEP